MSRDGALLVEQIRVDVRGRYAIGPAYGLLLDKADPAWRRKLGTGKRLDELLSDALRLQEAPRTSLNQRACLYDDGTLRASEVRRRFIRRPKRGGVGSYASRRNRPVGSPESLDWTSKYAVAAPNSCRSPTQSQAQRQSCRVILSSPLTVMVPASVPYHSSQNGSVPPVIPPRWRIS